MNEENLKNTPQDGEKKKSDRDKKGRFVKGNNAGMASRFKPGGEQAELSRQASQRSVEVRSERKSMAEWLQIAGEKKITNPKTGETLPRKAVIAEQVTAKATQGDLKAARLYAELTGELQTKVEISAQPPKIEFTKE